jgi:hypothetical protein
VRARVLYRSPLEVAAAAGVAAAEAVAAAEVADLAAEVASLEAVEVAAAAAAYHGEPAGGASSEHFAIRPTTEILVSGRWIMPALFTLPILPDGQPCCMTMQGKH